MFQLIDSVDPINNDNNSLKYSPKEKRFVGGGNNHNGYKQLAKVTIKATDKNLPLAYNRTHQRLEKRIHQLHGDSITHLKYISKHTDKGFVAIVSGIVIKFKNKQSKDDLTKGAC